MLDVRKCLERVCDFRLAILEEVRAAGQKTLLALDYGKLQPNGSSEVRHAERCGLFHWIGRRLGVQQQRTNQEQSGAEE